MHSPSPSHPVALPDLDQPTVRRIVEAARACFGREGYEGASMARIAAEAGVSKSLVHYHFTSKEQLFLAVQLELCRSLLDHVRALTGETGDVARLRGAFDAVIAFIERDLDGLFVLLEFRRVMASSPAAAEGFLRFQDEVLALVEQAVARVLGPLVDRLEVPPPRLARLLVTVFHGIVVDLALAQGEEVRRLLRETVEDVWRLLEGALIAPMAGGPAPRREE